MKKFLGLFLVIVLLNLLSSCIGKNTVFSDEGQKADARLEQIILAIKDNDRETLKSLFSKKALEEANDFENAVDYLFGFIEGTIESWERENWYSGGLIEKGKKNTIICSWHKFTTDKKNYLVFLTDYPTDTFDPDNVGLYALRIIREDDKKTQFTYWQDMQIAGIYMPEE